MAYIGNNPKLKSIVSSGDTLANLTAEPRKAGRLAYATDEGKFYYDDGSDLNPVGDCPNGVDTKANLDALPRAVGNLYYATDDELLYVDDGTVLKVVGGGFPLLAQGSLITSNGTTNGELSVGSNNDFLKANSAATDGTGLEWVAIQEVPETGTTGHYLQKTGAGANDYSFAAVLQVPSGGTTGHVLTKTAGGYAWQAAAGGGMQITQSIRRNASTQDVTYTVPSGDYSQVSWTMGNISGVGENYDEKQSRNIFTAGTAIRYDANGFSQSNIFIDNKIVAQNNNGTQMYLYIVTFSN